MPLNSKTYAEYLALANSDFERHGRDPYAEGSIDFALVRVCAQLALGLGKKIEYVSKQIFIHSADEESILNQASERGVELELEQKAIGVVIATGMVESAPIALGSVLTHEETGLTFVVTQAAQIASGTASVLVECETEGEAGNLFDYIAEGAVLKFTPVLADIDEEADVHYLTGGREQETIEELGERLLDLRREPPRGGANADYERWVKAAHSAITRVWSYPVWNGGGSMGVRFVTEKLLNPIPPDAVVDVVVDYVEAIQPAQVENGFDVLPLLAKEFKPVFTALDPDTLAVRSAVMAELADYLSRAAEPGGTLKLSNIIESISRAEGEISHAITWTTDFTCDEDEFPVLAEPTWPA